MPKIAIAPTNLNVVAGARQAALNWTYAPKTLATGFRLFLSDNGGLTWSQRPDLPLDPKQTTVTGLLPGRTYQFRIQAIHSKTGSESNFSNVVAVPIPQEVPVAPINLKPGAIATTTVDLSWTDCSDNEAGFRIDRSDDGGASWTQHTATATDIASVTVGGLVPGKSYQFQVSAYNIAGTSKPAGPIAVKTAPLIPAPPTNLRLQEKTATAAILAWNDASDGEDGFVVERSDDLCQTWVPLPATGANVQSQLISGLSANTTYHVRIKAYNTSGESPYAGPLEFKTAQQIPNSPSDLEARNLTSTSVVLVWADRSGNTEEGFRVERSLDGGGNWVLDRSTGANVTTATITGLLAATTYRFRVKAFNGAGESAPSVSIPVVTPECPPAAPTALAYRDLSATGVWLTWNDASGNEEGFQIERSVDGGKTWVKDAVTATNTSSVGITNLVPRSPYQFRVYAYNSAGSSSPSVPVEFTTPARIPNPPNELKVGRVTATSVELTWTDASGDEDGFRIERSDDGGRNWAFQVTASKNATSQTVTGLFPERAYRFQVKSFNSAGSSAAAGPVDATTLRQPPAAPQNLKVASQTTSSVILTWTDCSENEDGFRIEQTQGDGKTWGRSATTGPNTQAAEVTGLASGQKYDFRVFAFNSAGDSLPAGPVTTTITGTPPAKPLVLSASNPTATTVDVAWTDASSNELAFVIEGSRDLGQTWGELASTLANVVRTTLTGLAPETRYQLRVVATNAAGKSGSSNVVEVTTLGQPPAAPDNLAFDPNTLTATGVELTWRDNSATESEFEVFRSPGAVGSWERVGATGANVTRYKATGLSALTSYQFRVRAKNVWGVSTDSAAVVVTTRMSPPNAPQKLTASNITARSLDLAWIDCSQDEDDFLIACSINGGPFAPLAVVARNVTKYAVSNLQPLTKYCFQVQARNQGGGSDFTPAVCLQTKGVPPTAPSGFEVRSVTGTTAALAWKDTSGNEDEFVVVGRIDGEPADRLLAKFGANQVTGTLTGLKAATRYLLKLQARNTWGESDFAGPVECLTAFVIPDVPQQLTAVSASGTQIDLSWTLAEQFVDWFDVHYRLEGSEAWSASQPSPPGSARRTSVTGLNPDTRYDFRIRAVVNRAGASDWSNVATAATRMVLPNPPANLAVGTVTATTVDLSWQDASNNEAEFQVSLSADQGTNWKVVGASSANTPRFQVRDLKPQTEYRFRVQACNGAGCSEPTAAVSATTKQAPPPIPTDLVVDKVQARQLDLSWRDVPEETGYEIERSLDGGTTFAPLTKTGANQTRVTVTGLEPRKQVVFRVRAVNSAGYSDWSKPVGGTTLDEIPAIPGKPSVVSTTSRSIDLKWADNSDNESEFVLEMSDNAGRDWKIAARTAANTPRALVSGLLPLKEYAFRAQARNDVGASSFSEILRETTGGEAPQPPECLVATNVTQGTADLAWVDKSSDEQFFDVEISRDRRQSWQPFKTVAANVIKLPVTGLEAGTEYWFQVRARNSYGSSAPAGPVKVETLGTPPARPVLALDGFDSTTVDLSWNIPKSQVTSLELSSSLDQGRNWTVVARPKPTETKARVSNLTAATEYRFRLEAFNGTVSSGTSNEVVARTKSLIPAAPSQLKVSEPSATSLKLTWCDNSTNETKFEIEISDTDGASFVPLGATAANVTSFSVGSLVENRKYCFRVLARNDGGASAWSETACGSTLAKVPAAPTDLVVKSATANSAVVQWKAGPLPFDAFQISWRPAGQSTWTTQKKLPATTLTETLTGLAIDTAYEVTVSAFNAGVESKANPVVSFVTIPAAPTGFCTLNPTANSLTLKWNDASQTEGEYRLQRSTDGGKTWSAQEKLAANSTSRVVDSLAADTSHRFRLVAANGAGESAAVEAEGRTLVAPPSAPTNLKALAVNADSVQLSWTDTSANETGFEVFRSDDERQTWRSAGQTAANATSLTDKGLASLKKYWYRVRAFNAAGNSEFSDWLEVTTLLAVPKAPSGVCVVNPKPTTLDVKWTDNSDNEDAFVVLVSSDKVVFREGARVGAGANCATLTGLVAETDYTVKVQALNRAGTSGDSNLATGRTARRAPDQVGGLRIIDKSSTTLTLAWDSPDARATVLQLDISRDGGLSWQYCQSPRRDSTSTMVGDLSPNREYVFRIRAENEAGVSSWSAETRGCTLPPPPASPTNFAAKSVGNIKLTLTWKNVATDANRNLIRISYDQGQTFQDFALLDFFNESWVITGLKPNTPYVFELFAVNGGLFSAPIPRLTVTTDCTPPTDPSNLRAVNIGTNSVDLAWKGASREEGYEFEVSTDGGSSWRFFDTSPADKVEYRATGLKRNQRYRFRVRAVNSVRKSSWAVSEDFRTK